MGHIEGASRDQRLFFPDVLDDDIAEAHPVRCIEAFVDSLDLDALGFRRAQPEAMGRPAYHPGDLLTLYIDGSMHRIRSSRRLEQATYRHVALLWLLRTLPPDFTTSADLRKDTTNAFTQVLRACTVLWKAWDVCGAEFVAIDGRKCKAVNTKQRHVPQATLRDLLHAVDAKLAQYFRAVAAADAAEAEAPQPTAAALRENIQPLRERKGRYAQLRAALEASGASQVSLTAPDSRAMPTSPTVDVGDKVQTAVDAKQTLLREQHVTNAGTDVKQRSAMASAAQERLGVEPLQVVADMGDSHGEAIQACEEAGIAPYGARPLPSAKRT